MLTIDSNCGETSKVPIPIAKKIPSVVQAVPAIERLMIMSPAKNRGLAQRAYHAHISPLRKAVAEIAAISIPQTRYESPRTLIIAVTVSPSSDDTLAASWAAIVPFGSKV